MNTGDIVKFAQPLTADEAAERFRVTEPRGDRMLVEMVDESRHWAIVPTFVYLTADMVKA